MQKQIDQDLLSAIARNSVALADGLLKAGVDINAKNDGDVTPLHFTAERYSIDVARFLLDHGADIDAQDCYGNTPLFRAILRSKRGTQLELIRLLLSRGANPDVKNKNGESPRDLAKGSPSLEKLLARE